MFKIMLPAVIGIALMATSAQAQDIQNWEDVQSFLERNPETMAQLQNMMDYEVKPEQVEMDKAYIAEHSSAIFFDPATPILGNPDGEVLIVKFSDYRCVYCDNITPVLQELIDSDPRVRIAIREYPILGPDSSELAKFALAVKQIGGDGVFASAEKILFKTNSRITGYLLEGIATDLGLDPQAVIEAMDGPQVTAQIEETYRLADGLRITGTPGLIIGDLIIRGSVPLDVLQHAVYDIYPE